MAKIVLDTNFLLAAVQFRVDAFGQLREFGRSFVVLRPCVSELEEISRKKSKPGVYARIALQMIKHRGVKTTRIMERSTDTAILRFAEKHGCMVATNDKKLIKRLRNKGIKIIRLRQKKYLVSE